MAEYLGMKDFKHEGVPKVGVLLSNLGTPDAPTKQALYPYLKEFLWDPRVIEVSRPLWWLILHTIVLPRRPKMSAELYKKVWTDEGSPLLLYTRAQAKGLAVKLREKTGHAVLVEVGMRYGKPSIASALNALREQGAQKLLVLPLYPQYSGTTTASTFDAVADVLRGWRWIPEFRMVMQFHDHPGYIKCLAESVRAHRAREGNPERLVFSFHGIPKRYLLSGDPYFCHCHKTARLTAEALGLASSEYTVAFQSRFGKEEWLKPYTDEVIKELGRSKLGRLDVMCPGFISDCLETIEEIDGLNREFFHHAGGGEYRYIPALNTREDFFDFLATLALDHLGGWIGTGEKDEREAAKEGEARKSRSLAVQF